MSETVLQNGIQAPPQARANKPWRSPKVKFYVRSHDRPRAGIDKRREMCCGRRLSKRGGEQEQGKLSKSRSPRKS